MPPLKKPTAEEARNATRGWMKYSGMAMQMIGVLLAFVFGGIYLDQWLGSGPWLTVVLSLLGVGTSLYVALKDFL